MKTETETAKRRDMFAVRPENISVEEGFNIRVDYGDINELAKSIKENGQKMPIRGVRSDNDPNKYIVIDGHRRFAAIKLAIEMGAEIEFVDMFLEPKRYNMEERTMDMLHCNDGLPLRQIELAALFLKMQNVFKWSIEKIIEKSGKSSALVYNLLNLATVPEEIKSLIVKDKISEGTVMAIQKSNKDKDKLKALVLEAVDNATEEAVKTGKAPKKATAKHIKSTNKLMTTDQILDAVVAKIKKDGVSTDVAELILEFIKDVKAKKNVNALCKMVNE
jgi:ParB family transcriptional regulator, chromosome partitioning protein